MPRRPSSRPPARHDPEKWVPVSEKIMLQQYLD
jgi:hypothetical protein